jgi:hypothetical protein
MEQAARAGVVCVDGETRRKTGAVVMNFGGDFVPDFSNQIKACIGEEGDVASHPRVGDDEEEEAEEVAGVGDDEMAGGRREGGGELEQALGLPVP